MIAPSSAFVCSARRSRMSFGKIRETSKLYGVSSNRTVASFIQPMRSSRCGQSVRIECILSISVMTTISWSFVTSALPQVKWLAVRRSVHHSSAAMSSRVR